MQVRIPITCPYCGHQQTVDVEPFKQSVTLCSAEDGGCDGEYVTGVMVRYTPVVKRIEGEIAKLQSRCSIGGVA